MTEQSSRFAQGEHMPSQAYGVFKKNLEQVERLLKNFKELRPPTKGRKHLDHLTRAAILFLCAAWEVYLEQITLEGFNIIICQLNSPKKMPLKTQKILSKKVKDAKNEIEPVNFASDWKGYFCKEVETHIKNFHTPKKDKVVEIFKNYFGASDGEIEKRIPALQNIDAFVEMRGAIAHNIYSGEYVKEDTVLGHKKHVIALVKEIELFLWDYLPKITNGKKPWRDQY